MWNTPNYGFNGDCFYQFRTKVLAGKSEYSGWSEWSVEDIKDVNDIDSWYLTNPSLGYHLTERKIKAEIGDDELDHNIQRLGYWPSFNQKSAISENEWKRLKVDDVPELSGKLFVGIKYGQDGSNVSMSIAARTIDKKIFIEVIDCQSVRNGMQWIINFCKPQTLRRLWLMERTGKHY